MHFGPRLTWIQEIKNFCLAPCVKMVRTNTWYHRIFECIGAKWCLSAIEPALTVFSRLPTRAVLHTNFLTLTGILMFGKLKATQSRTRGKLYISSTINT